MHINQRINEVLKSTEAALELMEIEKDNLEIVKDLGNVIRNNNQTLLSLQKVRAALAKYKNI